MIELRLRGHLDSSRSRVPSAENWVHQQDVPLSYVSGQLLVDQLFLDALILSAGLVLTQPWLLRWGVHRLVPARLNPRDPTPCMGEAFDIQGSLVCCESLRGKIWCKVLSGFEEKGTLQASRLSTYLMPHLQGCSVLRVDWGFRVHLCMRILPILIPLQQALRAFSMDSPLLIMLTPHSFLAKLTPT